MSAHVQHAQQPSAATRADVDERPRPVGGRILTPVFSICLMLWALGTAAGLVRFFQGLGAASAMNDGYPWGIWIALDVVCGTALGSGGYACAVLVYMLNRGKYHPLMRPALLTSALGYTVGAVAIVFDVGRYWGLWKVPILVPRWNMSSALLEVALCVMAYTTVLWIEVSPALLEGWAQGPNPKLRAFSERLLPLVRKAIPVLLALGIVLPTMHQSTLGSLFLVSVTKLHKLWHTPLLPLLFLVTCFGMGYAAVVFESILAARSFGRRMETPMLRTLAPYMAGSMAAYVVLRVADVALRGRLGLAFAADWHALLFWAEIGLAAWAAVMLATPAGTRDAGALLRSAGLLVLAGAAYRVDVYITAFDPGNGWRYFPSVGELLVTLGLAATETMAYLVIVKKFPILAGAPARPAAAPAVVGEVS